ncbi:MAG TPA: hypothetical protein VMA32_03250 [Streptosporangiaceae bacterium]|nr:hypothetical protein [Streptosporangiaceae bacterium]
MQLADSSQISPRPRFPALDPEPPPRPWRRAGVTLIVILVAVLGSLAGYSLSRTRTPHPKPATVPVSFVRGLTGIVLAETPGSYLAATDMQTGKTAVFKNLGQFSSNPGPTPSADGQYLLDADVAKLLSLSSLDHPRTVPNALSFSPGDMPGFMTNPWTDHDTGVVELHYPLGAAGLQATVPVAAVQFVRTGHSVSLGKADAAAGDPQRTGAFIAAPRPGPALPDGNQPDASLVLADVGARSRVLATTAQLCHVLGVKHATTVSLVPIPNPQGSMVAVAVSTVRGRNYYSAGIVLLSRKGKVLGSQPGASAFSWTGWSHSGSTLAFLGYSRSGPELTEWTPGVRTVTTALAASSKIGPTACVWSPDDAALACDGGPHGDWLVVRSGTESVADGQGQPLLWASGRLGG